MERHKHSGFQWAQIELLKAVSAEFIFRTLITEWRTRIKQKPLFASNVLTGFLNVHAMLNDHIAWEQRIKSRLENTFQQVSSRTDLVQRLLAPDWKDFISQKSINLMIDALLVNEIHLLFNSYFYSTENVYGHERFFFRKIWQDVENLTIMLESFDQEKIPFRIYRSEEFIGTYSNQLLPVSAGVTPLFLHQFQKRGGKSSFKVKYFLESLALLHKREDFVQGHYSAIINIINGEPEEKEKTLLPGPERPFRGAFILTCMLPNAFTDEHETLLSAIIKGRLPKKNNMMKLSPYYANKIEMLRDQYYPFKLNHKKFFSTHPQPVIKGLESSGDNTNAALNDIVKKNFDLLMGVSKNNHLYLEIIYKCIINGQPQLSKHGFINAEGIYHIVKMLFPTASSLDYNLVSGNNAKKDLVYKLDFGSLKSYNNMLATLFSEKRDTGRFIDQNLWLNSDHLLAQFLTCLYPGRKSQDLIAAHIHVQGIGPESLHRLVIFKNDNVTPDFPDAVEHLKAVINETNSFEQSLPDGENPIFAKAEKDWISFQENTGNVTADLLSDRLFSAVRRLVENGARSILLLRERPYYIPDIPLNEDPKFISTIQSFPSFWVFERLCSYLTGAEHLYRFGDLKKSMNVLYRYPYKSGTKITVSLNQNDPEESTRVNGLLLFLGIHVHEIQINTEQTFLKIGKKVFTEKNIEGFYHEYLKFKVGRAIGQDNSLLPHFFHPFKIDEISWRIDEAKSVHMNFKLNGDTHAVEWHRYESFELDMAIIDIRGLSDAFSQNYTIRKETEILLNKVSIQQVIAASGTKEDQNYNAIIHDLAALNRFEEFGNLVSKIVTERNHNEAKILLESNEIFLHRIRRLNQYLYNSLQNDVSKKINRMLFELGFVQLREVQNQLFALSRSSSGDRMLQYDKTEAYSLEALLHYFYIKNLLFIDYTSIFSYVYMNEEDAFMEDMLGPMMTKIKGVHEPFDQSPLKSFFQLVQQDKAALRALYRKTIAAAPHYGKRREKRPLHLECQNDIAVLLPINNLESFWNYLSAIFDEITDNSLQKARKINVRLDGQVMLITAELEENKEPFPDFKNAYAGQNFIRGEAIRPIIDPYLGRISYGVYGIKIACKELGWDFGIRYDDLAKTILYEISFPQSSPFTSVSSTI